MTFEDLKFLDNVWMYEVPVSGKLAHQIFNEGVSFRASQNERLEGYNEGKFVVEIHNRSDLVETLVLSPTEITVKLQEFTS